jgi:hypothetical protein
LRSLLGTIVGMIAANAGLQGRILAEADAAAGAPGRSRPAAGSVQPASDPAPSPRAHGPFRLARSPAATPARSHFWTLGRDNQPPPNGDAAVLGPAFELAPLAWGAPPWSRSEDAALGDAALRAVRSARFVSAVGSGGGGGGGAPASFEAAAAAVGALTLTSPGVEAEVDALPPAAWARLAASALPSRTGPESAARWREAVRPAVAAAPPWTPSEDAALAAAVAARGARDWVAIASDVASVAGRVSVVDPVRPSPRGRPPKGAARRGRAAPLLPAPTRPPPPAPDGSTPVRTPAACFARHLATTPTTPADAGQAGPAADGAAPRRPHAARRVWTADLDAALAAAVARHGLGNWAAAAGSMPGGLTPHQLMHRWRGAVAPALGVAGSASAGGGGGAPPRGNVLGSWTAGEDAALRAAVAAAGGPGGWARIAGGVPGRTDIQCRSRWTQLEARAGPGGAAAWAGPEFRALEAAVGAVAAECQAQGRVRLRWPAVAARLAARGARGGGGAAPATPRTPDECRWAWHRPQVRAAREALAARPAALVASAVRVLEAAPLADQSPAKRARGG